MFLPEMIWCELLKDMNRDFLFRDLLFFFLSIFLLLLLSLKIQIKIMITEQTIEQIKKILLSEHEIEQIILFGSQARGDSDENSDIDLLLISKNIQNRFELMRSIRRKLNSIPFDFDTLTITPEEYDRDRQIYGTLARYGYQDGKVIYAS